MTGLIRGVFGYCFLVFMARIVGRRPGKQMTQFDYVLIFFMGGLTLTPMIGDDRSLTNALCVITAIGATHVLFAWLKQKSRRFSRLVDGTPLVLLEKGQWHIETMKKMRIQEQDVMATARDRGIKGLEEIEYAVLERNGEISIIETRDSREEG